jgi:hypothetical protein
VAKLYSQRFFAQAGLSGTGGSVIVPTGYVYIVKQVTIYAAPLLAQTAVFLEDENTGAALFAARFVVNQGGWVGFYGAIVFEAGGGIHFQVNNAVGESADVYAGGYVLTAP